MNAFFSATDDANENATQFYGVWGKVEDEEPQFAFRYVSGGTKEEIEPDVLFDWPVVTIESSHKTTVNLEGVEDTCNSEVETFLYRGPFPREEYPKEWMDQHEKSISIRYPHGGAMPYQSNTYGRTLQERAQYNYKKPWRSNHYAEAEYNDYEADYPFDDSESFLDEIYGDTESADCLTSKSSILQKQATFNKAKKNKKRKKGVKKFLKV